MPGTLVSGASPVVLTTLGSLAVDSPTLVVDAVNNRVGIGTAAPAVALDLNTAAASLQAYFRVAAITSPPFSGSFSPAYTNTIGAIITSNTTTGGLTIDGVSNANAIGLILRGIQGSASPTTPALAVRAYKSDGATGFAALAASETMFEVQNNTTARFTVQGTGNVTIAAGVASGAVGTTLRINAAAHTAMTASTEHNELFMNVGSMQWATGALTTQRFSHFTQPTLTFVGASTVTDAATVGIAGAPVQGTNATLTNTHGLLIQAGAVSTAGSAYGLTVNAPTGASANYAAQFIGAVFINGSIGFFAHAVATQQTSTETLVNSVTSGGTTGTVDNVVAAGVDTTAASLVTTRNAMYQLARKVLQIQTALVNYGLLAA